MKTTPFNTRKPSTRFGPIRNLQFAIFNLKWPLFVVALAFCLLPSAFCLSALAQGTAFTYQGQLADGGAPANGTYDLRFTIYDSTNVPGTLLAGPLTLSLVDVTNGLFTVTLDFGAAVFTGQARWLDIGVRSNGGGAFTPLTPRQPLTPTPYAIYARKAALLDGVLPGNQLSGLYPNAVTLNNAVNSFSGSGAGLTGLNASQLTTGMVPSAALGNAWKIGGNIGTTAGMNFLGTIDAQPLELKVNSQRALRLEPGTGAGVNMIGGSWDNQVEPGVGAATIAGGAQNTIRTASYSATIGGGRTNRVDSSAPFGTVAGGTYNWIQIDSSEATIAGGSHNTIGGGARAATLGGGFSNTIETNAQFATLGGGAGNAIQPSALYATLAGGYYNTIGTNNTWATLSGGGNNTIEPNVLHATLAGGIRNTIQSNAYGATIGGGEGNTVQTNAARATIAGGYANTVQSNAARATIGGGYQNMIQTNARSATIAGGINNTIESGASAATLAGGSNNTIQLNAYGATLAGGSHNTIQANADYATIPGGRLNSATNYAFAAGHRAKADHTGTFVWADAEDWDFRSTGTNQFLIRASGGVAIGTNSAGGALLNVLGRLRASTFDGDGRYLIGLNAANIFSGTLPDARLSANVSLLGPSIESTEIADGTIGSADVNAASFNTTFWRVDGNAGTTAGTHFLGTTDNQPVEVKVNGQRALRLEPGGSGSVNVIGGWLGNGVAPGVVGATVAGGSAGNYLGSPCTNRVEADFGTVSGGWANTIQSYSLDATIGGGGHNTIQTNAYDATIGGGWFNLIQSESRNATIAGGGRNVIERNASDAAIGGGWGNTIQSNSLDATIGGGSGNTIEPSAASSTIGGGVFNMIHTNARYATISGGYGNTNQPHARYATIGGGWQNTIHTNAPYATLAGGQANTIQANATNATIGGGGWNDAAEGSTVGGGAHNRATNSYATVGGGQDNTAGGQALSIPGYTPRGVATHSTVSGGASNQARRGYAVVGGGLKNTNVNQYSVIAGGLNNFITGVDYPDSGTNCCEGVANTIGGGAGNLIRNYLVAPFNSYSTIAGGIANTVHGFAGTIPGGEDNWAYSYAFAAGRHATALWGSFVWGDSQDQSVTSSTSDQFVVRARGGVWFGTTSTPTSPAGRFINTSTGGYLSTGGAWTDSSDRNAKENFQPVDGRKILERVSQLPISTWNYKTENAAVRHIGPVAQDFHAAFQVGQDDLHLAALDGNGVALAAIQGLNQKVEAKNAALEKEVAELKELVKALAATVKAGARAE